MPKKAVITDLNTFNRKVTVDCDKIIINSGLLELYKGYGSDVVGIMPITPHILVTIEDVQE